MEMGLFFLLVLPIVIIFFAVIFLRRKERKPFKDIEKGLDFGLDGIIDSLKELSNNKLKVGFWENSFFLGFTYATLHSLIREYSNSNEFHFTESEENEMILDSMIKLKGNEYAKTVARIVFQNEEESAEGLLIGKKLFSIIYYEKNIPKSVEYMNENVIPRYRKLEDKFEDEENVSYAFKFGQLFSPLNKNNKISRDLEDLENLYKNKTISEDEYKETRKSILKKYYS